MPDGICPFAEQIIGVNTYQHGYTDRVGFCDHTAGGYYDTLRSAAFWNQAGVSVHFGISLDGRICQMVNIFDTAYAQGRLGPKVIWPPYNEMQQTNPNLYLISTEHEDKQVTNLHWPDAMYQADLKLKRWCIEEVKRVANKDMMRFGIDSLAGHVMFDQVNRPYCPGKWWETDGRFLLFDDLMKVEDDVTSVDNLWADLFHTLLKDYSIKEVDSEGHPWKVYEVINKDGTSCDPIIKIADRSLTNG